jgi:thiol-disulfide isomerase/thioredoxin
MKRNLLLLVCLLGIANLSYAQKKGKRQTEVHPTVSNLTIPGTAFLRSVNSEMEVKFDYKQMNAPLPKFTILNYENKNTTNDVLQTGGNLVLIMFNPTCEHCEDETRLLIQNIFMFKKSKILMVAAPVQTPNLSYFETNVKFSQYPSTITVAIDSAKLIDKIFTYKTLPQINIYDGKSMRLMKTFEGFTPLDSLRQYIQ